MAFLARMGQENRRLMKILSGFQPADEGEIWIDGRAGGLYTVRRRRLHHGVGMLQQDPLDVPAFTVLENFMYGSNVGFSPNRREAKAKLSAYSQRFGFDLHPSTPIAAHSVLRNGSSLEIVRLLALGVRKH